MMELISFFHLLGAAAVEAYVIRLVRRDRVRALPWPDFDVPFVSKGTLP